MREILFKGKQSIDNEWCEGYYYSDGTKFYIAYEGKKDCIIHEVIPKTVGQFTGLTDKNKKKIFEGDIVKCTYEPNDCSFTAVVMFGNSNGEYDWGFQLKRISGANVNTDILLWVEAEDAGAYIEVIGNIHDNPELLKA